MNTNDEKFVGLRRRLRTQLGREPTDDEVVRAAAWASDPVIAEQERKSDELARAALDRGEAERDITPLAQVADEFAQALVDGLNRRTEPSVAIIHVGDAGTKLVADIALTKSRGQRDYEADVARKPNYHDGTPRKTWLELGDLERRSWESEWKP